MNLIEELGIEKCKRIVNGAPEMAFAYDNYESEYLFEGDIQDGFTVADSECCYLIDDIRTAIADHDSKDGIKKNDFKIGDFIRYMGIDGNTPMFGVYEVVGFSSTQVGGDGYQIKNKLGQIDFCYGDNYALVDCGITDHCTDIRNHVSPNTKVIEG